MSGLLNKWNLRVAAFAATQESRHTLRAIHVTPEATVATDAFSLGWVSTPKIKAENFPVVGDAPAKAEFSPFLLGLDTARAVDKALPKKTTIPALECVAVTGQGEDGETRLAVTDLETSQTFAQRKVAGMFPNWTAVMPVHADDGGKPVFRIALNGKLLKRVVDAMTAFADEGRGQAALYLSFYGDDRGMRIDATRAETEQGMTAVLMPMRGADTDAPECYGWTAREAKRQATAEAERAAREAAEAAQATAAKELGQIGDANETVEAESPRE